MGVYLQFALTRVSTAIRQEQLQGTLESMLSTPTAPTTVQLGLVVFDLYVPVRTFLFLAAMTLVFDLRLLAGGVRRPRAPARLTPFVWGLGVLGAAIILVVRKGAGIAALAGGLIALASGAYVLSTSCRTGSSSSLHGTRSRSPSTGCAPPDRRPRLERDGG